MISHVFRCYWENLKGMAQNIPTKKRNSKEDNELRSRIVIDATGFDQNCNALFDLKLYLLKWNNGLNYSILRCL
jgi:hypothetical protein